MSLLGIGSFLGGMSQGIGAGTKDYNEMLNNQAMKSQLQGQGSLFDILSSINAGGQPATVSTGVQSAPTQGGPIGGLAGPGPNQAATGPTMPATAMPWPSGGGSGVNGNPNAALAGALKASAGQPPTVANGGASGFATPIAAQRVGGIESGGSYTALGPVINDPKNMYFGDRAYGKYGVMGKNIGPWTKEVLGQAMTPEQFLNSPGAQDVVFQAKYGQGMSTPGDAASAWLTGQPLSRGANMADQNGTTGAAYAQAVTGGQGGAMPAQAGQPTGGMQQGGYTLPQVVAAIKAKGLSGPAAGAALQAFLPFLQAQDRMYTAQMLNQYRAGQLALGQERADQGQQRVDTARADEQRKQEQGDQRLAIQQQNADTARQRVQDVNSRFDQNIQLKKDALAQAKDLKEKQMKAQELRQAWQEKRGALQSIIQAVNSGAVNLSDDQKQKLNNDLQQQLQQGDADVEKAVQDARNSTPDGATQSSGTVGGATSKVPEPPKAETGVKKSWDVNESLTNARAAIASGIPRDKVIQRLRDEGIDPSGL